MRNLRTKPVAYTIFFVFALSYPLVALATGTEIKDLWSALVASYKTIPIVLGFWWVFTMWGWRWRIFRGWLVPFPDLNGTWIGVIKSNWVDPKTGQTVEPIPTMLTIKQSFGRISCVMRTGEMVSRSFFADFWIDGDEQVRKLGFCYTSDPSAKREVSSRSRRHDGTAVFEIVGKKPTKLNGTYWTSRETTGEISLCYHSKDQADELPENIGRHPMSET